MAEEQKPRPQLGGLDAKWDACLDLGIRRVAYSSLAGALGGLLLFRSPATRWASVAFGAGLGLGTAYTECSYIFDGSLPKLSAPQVSTVPSIPSQVIQEQISEDLFEADSDDEVSPLELLQI